jgi:hypothetical protein
MSKFLSRKFLLVVAAALFNLVNGLMEARGMKPLSPEALNAVNMLIMVFVGAEGAADVVGRIKGK